MSKLIGNQLDSMLHIWPHVSLGDNKSIHTSELQELVCLTSSIDPQSAGDPHH